MEREYKDYICQKCKNFFLIDFENNNKICCSCKCYKRKDKLITVLFKKENNYLYFENKSNSSTRINTDISNKTHEIEKKEINSKIKNDNKDIVRCKKKK